MKVFDILPKIMMAIVLFIGCAANAPQEGTCVRSCGSRPIGGGNIKGQAVSGPLTIEKCDKGSELPQVKYLFFIYEDMTAANGSGGSSGGGTGSNAQFPNRIGKAGIAVTPLVDGYNRIDTPTKDLCTDSCGFVEIAFTPTCYEQNVQVGVLAPGMTFEQAAPTIAFTVTDPQ